MIEEMKRERRLAVLRLGLGASNQPTSERSSDSGSRQDVLLTIEFGGQELETVRISAGEVGLPRTIDEARSYHYGFGYNGPEPKHKMPDRAISHLRSSIELVLDTPDAPLWLQFDNSCGFVPMLPWERMLQQGLGRRIVRLPYFYLEPFKDLTTLNVAICASDPAAKAPQPIPEIIHQIVDSLAQIKHPNLSIHVFADVSFYDQLNHMFTEPDHKSAAAKDGDMQLRVTVHNPQEAASYEPPERSVKVSNSLTYMESPWLHWMNDKLGGQGIDIVQFVCHGYLSLDQGALAFAESPVLNEDRQLARFVGPQTLSTFLNNIGAWSVGFTYTTESNFSMYGLRLLADQVARLGPGPLFMHELQVGGQDVGLTETYGFLYNGAQPATSPRNSIALYCHPDRFPEGLEPELAGFNALPSMRVLPEDTLEKYTLAQGETLSLLRSPESAPAWMLSSQRYLEQTAAQLVGEGDETSRSPAQEGALDALMIVRNVLARHALKASQANQSDVGESGSSPMGTAGIT